MGKLVKVPDNIKREFERVLTSGGLFKIVSQHPTYFGDTHYQILSTKQYEEKDWKRPVDKLVAEIDRFEDKYHETGARHSDIPVTWNFGYQDDKFISAGVDLDKMWVADDTKDSVEDSYYSENDKKDKEFVKNALSEMRRYVRNWNYMSSQDKRNIGCSLQELQKRIKELEEVEDSIVKDSKIYYVIKTNNKYVGWDDKLYGPWSEFVQCFNKPEEADKYAKSLDLNNYQIKKYDYDNKKILDEDTVEDAHEYKPKGNEYLYLFPDEPAMGNYKSDCKKFGLEFIGKNKFQGYTNLVIRGSKSNLRRYADYLDYDLHPDFLYRERDFAGDIEDSIVKDAKIFTVFPDDGSAPQDFNSLKEAINYGNKYHKRGFIIESPNDMDIYYHYVNGQKIDDSMEEEVKDAKEPLLIRFKEQGNNQWNTQEFDSFKQFKDWVAMSGKGTYNVWVMWIKKNGEFVFKDGPVRVSEINFTDSVKDENSRKARITVWIKTEKNKQDLDFICKSLNTKYKILKSSPTELKVELNGNVSGVVEDLRSLGLMSTSLSSVQYVDSIRGPKKDSKTKDEIVKTPRGTFQLVNKTEEELRKEGYGFHHMSEDGKYKIMTNSKKNAAVAIKAEDSVKDSIDKNKIKNLVNSGKYPNTYYDIKKNDIQSSSAREIADIARKLGVEDKYSYEWDGYHLDLNWLKNEIKYKDSINTKHIKLIQVINKLNKYKDSKVKDVKFEQVKQSKNYTGENPKIFGKANEIETSEEARLHYGKPCGLYKFDNGKVALVVGETNPIIKNCWLDYPQGNYTELGNAQKLSDDNKKHVVYFYD